MTSRSDRVVYTLRDLQEEIRWFKSPSLPISDICIEIDSQIEAVLPEFRFLTLFQGCIHERSDADHVVPSLGFLAIKIKATTQFISDQVEGEEVQSFRVELKVMEEEDCRSFQERASEILHLFVHLKEKISLLKPEIREVFKDLSGWSFWCYSPMCDFAGWDSFLSSLLSCLLKVEDEYKTCDSRRKRAQDIYHTLHSLGSLLYGLPDIPMAHDFSIHVANVTTRAALVSCHWWSRQFAPDMKEDLSIAFWDLQMKITFTDLHQIFILLRNLGETYADNSRRRKVTIFVRYILPFTRRFENFTGRSFWQNEHLLPFRFVKELESLTVSIVKDLKIPEEDFKNEKSFFWDFKLLISEIQECFFNSLPENGAALLNLLSKVWLMKMEIFILTASHDPLLFVEKQIHALPEELRSIKRSSKDQTQNVNQIFTFMEEVAKLVAALHHSIPSQGIDQDILSVLLLLLLIKILLFKLDRNIKENNGSRTFLFKDRLESYLEGSRFLINCCINRHGGMKKDKELKVSQIKTMARRIISLCYSLPTQDVPEKMIENMNLVFSDLEDEIKLFMAKLKELYLGPVKRSNFPKTNALGFFDALLSKLRQLLLNYKAKYFVSVKQHIEEILAHLEFFEHFLGDIPELTEESQEIRDLCGHVIDVAYDAEHLIDSVVHGIECEWHTSIWLYDLLQNVRHIRMQVTKVHEEKAYRIKVHNVPQTSGHIVSKITTPRIDDIVLTLDDQQQLIIDLLVGGYPKLDIVSVVGMPGIGKTTLAKKVYGSLTVAYHFHIRAWCCVTEVYRKREVLLEILSQIIVVTDNVRRMSDEDLDFKLRQLLLKKKYLIVLDDMWTTEAWDDLRISFPNDENGSRILITSRLNDVALKAKARSDAHHLRPLSDAESWTLLERRTFPDEHCPEELVEIGQEIAEGCKGLPLAVVAMAGLLQRINRQQSHWKEIAKMLSSGIVDPQDQCRDILELSYRFLPDYLKACFLYFGAFLEDKEISVTKLMQLWIAEGFVKKTEMKGQEDLAEDYMKDLIGRSLVIVSQPRSRGGTKACRVHDILRSFCRSKAEEDNFLRVITMSSESHTSFDELDFLVNDNFSIPLNHKIYEDHRLCFCLKRNHFIKSRPFGPLVRSLLYFGTNDKYDRSSYDVTFISDNFQRLKVLDLECINVGPSFPNGIDKLFELRYLAVSGDLDSIPSSIANLLNLETFLVKGLKGKVKLPDTLWCLKWLRHVHVTDVAVINLRDDVLGRSSLLDHLVSLSSLFLPYGEDTNNMLRKFPKLRKLGCIFSGSPDCSVTYQHFPRLDILTWLESVKISYYGRVLHSAEFSFPLSLKKLTLSNFRLPWSHMSVIGRLQNLEVLKLLSKAYEGETWDMVEGEFYNLRFLKLDTLNIAKWKASGDHLPNLQKLVLRNCRHLEEVPSSFVEISTLQMIEVQWCGKTAEDSVRRMREEADEWLKIMITSDLDSSLSL